MNAALEKLCDAVGLIDRQPRPMFLSAIRGSNREPEALRQRLTSLRMRLHMDTTGAVSCRHIAATQCEPKPGWPYRDAYPRWIARAERHERDAVHEAREIEACERRLRELRAMEPGAAVRAATERE